MWFFRIVYWSSFNHGLVCFLQRICYRQRNKNANIIYISRFTVMYCNWFFHKVVIIIILVKAIAGSHLFGTNTENSDHDFKGVFLPSVDDLLLGKFDQTIHTNTNSVIGQKNTKDDVDIELYSLDKFLKMLYQGQTTAWELLFTPDHMILEKHPLWDEIRAAAPQFLNKNISAFLGYCKQQAHKYGIRGSRMNSLEAVLKIIKPCMKTRMTSMGGSFVKLEWVSDLTLNCLGTEIIKDILELEHCEHIKDKNGKDLIVICGKKFGLDTNLQYVLQPLQKYYDEYGERSRKAKENEGIDWKALSHAVRVCMQAISLLENHKIELPMSEANTGLLKLIKAGKLPFDEVAMVIERYQDALNDAVENSELPTQADLKAFQDIQISIYKRYINGEI